MVAQYGMSERFGLMGLATVESQYLDGEARLNCGEETAAEIDKEVMKVLKKAMRKQNSFFQKIGRYSIRSQHIFMRKRILPEKNL